MIRFICKYTFYFLLLAAAGKSDGCSERYQGQSVSCQSESRMRFVLFTRSNPTDGLILDVAADNIKDSNFNATNPTKIVIHGHFENVSHYVDMRAEYFKKGEYNFIMIDWGYLTLFGAQCFATASTWTSHVGECVGGLIQLLRNNYQMTDVHVIGFGLGSVVIPSVADHVDPRLPRATGLDPPNVRGLRVSTNNADFLDVIHTNYNGRSPMGNTYVVGHVDFYVNNGINQPGCQDTSRDASTQNKMCSSTRALLCYIESINSETGFYGNGNNCSFSKVRKDKCSIEKLTILMGDGVLNTSYKSRSVVAVPTAAQSPFALGRKD